MAETSDSWIRMLHRELGSRLGSLVGHDDHPPTSQAWAQSLMADAMEIGASDIHISSQRDCVVVRFRVDGNLLDAHTLPVDDGQRLIRHFKVMADIDPTPLFEPAEAHRTFEVDGRDVDLRITCAPTVVGERMALRLMNPLVVHHSLSELGLLPEQLKDLRQWMYSLGGLLVVAGPTGSGKTTTLYALLHHFRTLERSVVTIEDPVEYQIDGVDQIQVNTRHDLNYARALRSVLRQDPDIILLGELRDADSALAGVEAGLSGQVVMSTLHARDAVGAVSVLRHWGVAPHDLATTLQVVISQRLVRTLCPACRYEDDLHFEEREWLTEQRLEPPARVWRPEGCESCRGIGYRGRIGVFELWTLTEGDQEAVAAGTDESQLRARLLDRGMMSLADNGLRLVESGRTSVDELGRICSLFVPGAQAAERTAVSRIENPDGNELDLRLD